MANNDFNTAEDIIRGRLRDCPGDLKVLTKLTDNLYLPIKKIRSCYVKQWQDADCFQEVEEGTKGAIHVMVIE